jgi:excisionase family DNA binding protein
MTRKEVADYLSIHQATLYGLIKRNEIPSFRIGSDYRFNRDSIERWIAERQQANETPRRRK